MRFVKILAILICQASTVPHLCCVVFCMRNMVVLHAHNVRGELRISAERQQSGCNNVQ